MIRHMLLIHTMQEQHAGAVWMLLIPYDAGAAVAKGNLNMIRPMCLMRLTTYVP